MSNGDPSGMITLAVIEPDANMSIGMFGLLYVKPPVVAAVRVIVALNWLWNYVTFQRGTRLITGYPELRTVKPPPINVTETPPASRRAV